MKALQWLEDSPSGGRAWCKIIGFMTALSLVWGLLVTKIIIKIYELKVPAMSWAPPPMMNIVDDLMKALFETGLTAWWLLALCTMFVGKKIWFLLLAALPLSIYYGWDHYTSFLAFAPRDQALFCAMALQGFLFFLWCLFFVKCIDVKDMFQLKALGATALVHGLYNILITRLIALFS